MPSAQAQGHQMKGPGLFCSAGIRERRLLRFNTSWPRHMPRLPSCGAWVGQLRCTETTALETELPQLRSTVDQTRNEHATLSASQQELKADIKT